jgi:hypothetical protein
MRLSSVIISPSLLILYPYNITTLENNHLPIKPLVESSSLSALIKLIGKNRQTDHDPVCKMRRPSDVSSILKPLIGWLAGPLRTLPSRVKREPWHGQAYPSGASPTVQPRCGQIKLKAVNPEPSCNNIARASGTGVRDPKG